MTRLAIGFKFNPRNLFNDMNRLAAKIGKQEAIALRKVGYQLRKRMKQIIRRRPGASKPGKPPHAHVAGNQGLKLVEFSLEGKFNLVVGPKKYARQRQNRPAPNVQEFGGAVSYTGNQVIPVRYLLRGRGRNRRRVPTVRGRPVVVPFPSGITERNGLLLRRGTGMLNRSQAVQVRRNMNALKQRAAIQAGRRLNFKRRPFAEPTLSRAIRDNVIPKEFSNLTRGL